jgi:hypothetical protein
MSLLARSLQYDPAEATAFALIPRKANSMVLSSITGLLFAGGVLAAGTLAGTTALHSGPVLRTRRGTAASQDMSKHATSPVDSPPMYLTIANQVWTRTHDAEKVRATLRLALSGLVPSDGSKVADVHVQPIAEDVAGVEHTSIDSGTVKLAVPYDDGAPSSSAPLVIVRVSRPVAISTRAEGARTRPGEWRQRWNDWTVHLDKMARPFSGAGLSAIEIGIETW